MRKSFLKNNIKIVTKHKKEIAKQEKNSSKKGTPTNQNDYGQIAFLKLLYEDSKIKKTNAQLKALDIKLVAQNIIRDMSLHKGENYVSSDNSEVIYSDENNIMSGKIDLNGSTYIFRTDVKKGRIVLSLYKASKTKVSDGDHYPTILDAVLYERNNVILSKSGKVRYVELGDEKDNILSLDCKFSEFYVPREYTEIIEPIIKKVEAIKSGKTSQESGSASQESGAN